MKFFEDWLIEEKLLLEEFKVPTLLKQELPSYSIKALTKLIARQKQYDNVDWQNIEVKKRKVYQDIQKYLYDPNKLFIYILNDSEEPYKPKNAVSYNNREGTLKNIKGEEVDVPKYGAFVGGNLWDLSHKNPIMINNNKNLKIMFYKVTQLFTKNDIKVLFEIILNEADKEQTELDQYKQTPKYAENLFKVAVKDDIQIIKNNIDTLTLPDIKGVSINAIRYVVSDEYKTTANNFKDTANGYSFTIPSKEEEQKIERVYKSALIKSKTVTDAIKRLLKTYETFKSKYRMFDSYFNLFLKDELTSVFEKYKSKHAVIAYNKYISNSPDISLYDFHINELYYILKHPIIFLGKTQTDVEFENRAKQEKAMAKWISSGGTLD
jgi:hypothetical protein